MSKRSARRHRHQNQSRSDIRAEIEDERAFEREVSPALTIHGNGNGVALPPIDAPQTEREVVTRVGEIVERAQSSVATSKQPRFSNGQAGSIFTSVYRWVNSLQEPSANATPRAWDAWLRNLVTEIGAEPHLAGVFASIVSIDKNRHYTVTGGRNQVNRVLSVLQDADDGRGWRSYVTWQSSSFWATRMGAITELGREGIQGPVRSLYSVDPANCELTSDLAKPLRYYPSTGSMQEWLEEDYFRAASMGSTNEKRNGLGFPFVARALDLARIMIAVWRHDQEELGAKAPRGLLLLKGISQDTWDNAMTSREEKLASMEREYYGGVAVLAGSGPEDVSAQLMALSNLPAKFSVEKWVSLYMYGLALCAGYDPREFYPVSGGQLGTATETETQHRKASSKGDLDFSLAHQEQLQAQLPATILFEYEQRDVEGEVQDLALQKAKVDLIDVMAKWASNGKSVLTAEQIMQLAAQHGVIPQEWTLEEENVTGDDTFPEVDETLANERVRRAVERFPEEPLVRYSSKTGQTRVLLPRAGDALKRRSYPVAKVANPTASNERSIDSAVSRFRRDLTSTITNFFNGGDISVGSVREIVSQGVYRAYTEALKEAGIAEDEIADEEFTAIDALTVEQTSYVTDFVKAVRSAKGDEDAENAIRARIDLWVSSIAAAGVAGLASAKKNEMVTWKLGETEEHCKTCQSLNGKRHRRSWFDSKGYVPRQPGSETLECGGWNCDCSLEA